MIDTTIATDPSHHTPQSTFTMNTTFDSLADTTNQMPNFNSNVTFSQDPSATLLDELDSSRFYLNDRVLAGDIVRPSPHNQPPIEKIKLPDKIQFTSEGTEPKLMIMERMQNIRPNIPMLNINPSEQIQRLIQQGKIKIFQGFILINSFSSSHHLRSSFFDLF